MSSAMDTVRTVVFPALRLLVWTVIAVALVVLAFRGGTGEAAPVSGGAPPVDLTSPVVPVARGTVANTVTVQGTVVADATVPVRATEAGTVRRVLVGAGVVVLVLGGLGVLNIGLVTVRQRIREIGVRRSFGATSARVFSAIVLESVCATFLAGLAAVALSVVLVRNLPLESLLNSGVPLAETPAFPVAAAVEGLVAATAVGALAGLLPAVIAVRAKVIDAIRF